MNKIGNKNIARFTAALSLLTLGLSAHAAPPAASDLTAIQAVTIDATGPKSGANSDKYFNIEGKDTGKYACYGILRFDGATLKKDLDKKYGAGKYKVTNVTLQLTQSPAKFSKDGPVDIYFHADATPDLNVQSLKYPYNPKDKAVGGSKIAVGAPSKTKAVAKEAAAEGESVTEAYNLTNDTSGSPLKSALEQGKIVTIVLTADGSVAETYAGLKGVQHRKAPTLVVSLNK